MTNGHEDTEDTIVTGQPVPRVADPLADTADTHITDSAATRITPPELPDDDTHISPRVDLEDATIVVRDGAEAHDTVLRAGVVDRTVIIGENATATEATVVGAQAPRPVVNARPAPGRLSGGRVAQIPTGAPERFAVRDASIARPEVVRTVIPAPAPSTRQTRDTAASQAATTGRRRTSGVLVVLAIVGVTIVTLGIVTLVVVLLVNGLGAA